jgi:hypothetical protein
MSHRIDLAGDWLLWRDFAVRSAGFPVEGLAVFGGADESAHLSDVARNELFREAVAWQSRESLKRAVDKHAAKVHESPSRIRRREEVVASYWQRYCAKNDTIGFFGPLAWGSFCERGEPLTIEGGLGVDKRVVHLETWAIEAVAAAAGVPRLLEMGPFPERDLRTAVEGLPAQSRDPAMRLLDQLEAARDAVALAPGGRLVDALEALDGVFESITGRPAARREDESGGGRTIAYIDCTRDLHVTLGAPVLEELRGALPVVLEASRWWCGRVFAAAQDTLGGIAHGRSGPLGPLLGEMMGAAWGLFEVMGQEQLELQRRWAAAVGDGDHSALRGRAARAFADRLPAWRSSVYQSADLQIAAADAGAIGRGEFQVVLGDFHGGINPLGQGLFAHRYPHAGEIAARMAAETGRVAALLPPRRGVVPMTARGFPVYAQGDIVVAPEDDGTPHGTRTVRVEDVVVHGGCAEDRAGSFRIPLAELLFVPVFIAAVRTFDPIGAGTDERVTIGRTVVRRARWRAPARAVPSAPAELAAWAEGSGMPRRVFARSPLERKPILIDFQSPALQRVLTRLVAPVSDRSPDSQIEFTEMLPGPEECWLQSQDGHHTSEFRIVAVDRSQLPLN